MNLNQNIIKKTYIFFISFLFIFFSCNSDDDHKTSADNTKTDTVTVASALTELGIADVSVTKGTTFFDISPTLIPSGATVYYELITKPKGVTMAGTRIYIVKNVYIGEYNITVKAIGNGDYTGETETTFRLMIIKPDDAFVINFRDLNFKKAVKIYLDIRTNEVTYGDIKDRTNLNVHNKRITNIEDMGYFTSLRELDCSFNELTSLDLSQNTVLEQLICYENQLTSLDLSQNTYLEELDCSNNQLTSLDLSQNTYLEELYCEENKLTSLDIRGMRSVLWLSFNNTTLQTLKVHQNIKNHGSIIDFKTAKGSNVTISTYTAPEGSTNYELICSDYVPRAGGGSCNDD